MKFITATFWEFIQNLVLVVSFVVAVWLWRQEQPVQSLFWIIIGGIGGALFIRFTELRIAGGFEPERVTLVNVAMLTSLMLFFTIYLGSNNSWSSWRTDVILGGTAAVLLAMVQAKAETRIPIRHTMIHSLALSLAFSILLITIRLLVANNLGPILVGSIAVTAVLSLVISLIEYHYRLAPRSFE